MRRLLLIAITGAVLAQATVSEELTGVFAAMASALSDANPEEFLRAFDRSMSGYQQLADNVRALATQNAVSCSVEIVSQKGDDHAQEVELEWLLEIKGIGQSAVSETREGVVKCKLERQKKKWRIVALDPVGFFAAPGADRQ
jgi:hypothetical protein